MVPPLQNCWAGGISGAQPAQPPARPCCTHQDRRVLNTGRKENAQPLRSLFHCSVTPKVGQFFLIFSWEFLYFSLCLLSLAGQNFLAGASVQGKQEQRCSCSGHQSSTVPAWLSSNPHTASPRALQGFEDSSEKFILKEY